MSTSGNFLRIIRQNPISKVLFFALALYLLNSSVDFQDQRIAHDKEDVSINEIESFAELIVEEIVCIDNFFEEQSESETEPTTKGTNTISYLMPDSLILPIRSVDIVRCSHPNILVFHYPADFSILTPPPQRA